MTIEEYLKKYKSWVKAFTKEFNREPTSTERGELMYLLREEAQK